jgi:hypothetical protein
LLFIGIEVGKHLRGDPLGQKPKDPQIPFFGLALKKIRDITTFISEKIERSSATLMGVSPSSSKIVSFSIMASPAGGPP